MGKFTYCSYFFVNSDIFAAILTMSRGTELSEDEVRKILSMRANGANLNAIADATS